MGLHPLSALHPNEKHSPLLRLDRFLRARQKSWQVLHEIRNRIYVGCTEKNASDLALEILEQHGVTRHWHKPYIRIGAGTALSYHDPKQPNMALKVGDPFYIDLGPVWTDEEDGMDYEGDVGDTFVFGENPEVERCIRAARQLFMEAQQAWNERGLTGEQIYDMLDKRSVELGYHLLRQVDGHRLADYPHATYSKDRLASISHAPAGYLWVLEVEIVHPSRSFGAFFEDMLIPAGLNL